MHVCGLLAQPQVTISRPKRALIALLVGQLLSWTFLKLISAPNALLRWVVDGETRSKFELSAPSCQGRIHLDAHFAVILHFQRGKLHARAIIFYGHISPTLQLSSFSGAMSSYLTPLR